MASRRSVRHSRVSEQLVSVEEALEMIHTQGSDVEEDINDSSNENFDPYSVDTDTEVGADNGEEADDALPAHEPPQHESLTLTGGKRLTILAEAPYLNILSEVFSPFSFSFTPEKTTASDTSLAFCE